MSHTGRHEEYNEMDIISHAWTIFTEKLAIVAGIVVLVNIMPDIAISWMSDTQYRLSHDPELTNAIIQLIEGLAQFLNILSIMAIAIVVKYALEKKEIATMEALRKALSSYPKTLGTTILAALLILVYSLLIIPGIMYFVYWYFVVYVVLFQNKSSFEALEYSKSLVKNRWWRTFKIAFLLWIFAMMVILLYIYFVGQQMNDSFVLTLSSRIFTNIIASYFSVATAVFYFNFEATADNYEREAV